MRGVNSMKSDNSKIAKRDDLSNKVVSEIPKKTWQRMTLTYAGEAKDLVRGGSGKIGITQADVGDTNKPKGLG
jgi:hypothetical protein